MSSHQENWQRRGPLGQKPCRFFLQTGICRFGSGCKFSHEKGPKTTATAASRPPRPPRTTARTETEGERSKYLDWKRLLRRQPSQVDNRAELENFWSQALAIVESSEVDQYQMLVRDLTDDQYAGCLYLIRTLELRTARVQWCHICSITRDMLKLITHPKVLDCLSIDTPVGTMYSIISGSNGNRVVPFLIFFSTGLESSYRRQDIPTHELAAYVPLMLEAIHELLRREKRMAFCEDLPTLFDQLDLVIPYLDTESDRIMKVDKLGVLRKIARLSTGLVTTSINKEQARPRGVASNTSSVYPRELKLPGTRHDNDHLNIAHISILPTVDELNSDQVDFLPSTDFRQPHFLDDPVQRYLDTHFRLLRHDIFGTLKEVLGALLSSVVRDGVVSHKPHTLDANVHLYSNSSISHISVDDKRGFEVHISFSPRSTCEERRRNSVSSGGTWRRGWSPLDIGNALRMYTEKSEGVLVELPGLLPATFSPVLENLQRMVTLGELPFQEWIIPKLDDSPSRTHNLEPPRYARAAGFKFSLDPIANGDGSPLSLSATSSPDDSSLINRLESRLTLDRGQCQALVAALTQEFSLIQGPPGTGKSYLGLQLIRVLLGCKKTARTGPIVIICYTNHALDQFLMHLKDVGITKFIRIGGQSRTRQLDEHNLKSVSTGATRTKHEGYLLGSTHSSLEDSMKRMGASLATFHGLRKDSLSALDHFLGTKHPKIYTQFFEKDAEGFTRVGKDPIGSWLGQGHKATSSPAPEALGEEGSQRLLRQAERDVYSVSPTDRRQLVEVWLSQMKQDRIELLHENILETEDLRKTINTVHSEVNRRTLAGADVIGITTTGMARDVSLLRGLRSKIVLCEEAGEVLEAHVISALMPSVEHFIQIGDHQQLRPTINNWSTLSLESNRGQDYQLDRSQFERLALGQPGLPPMPIAQLNIQRRMRPDIANLLRRTMYPSLEDHQSILELPNVVGMRENLFWLNHDHLEDAASDEGRSKSHSNTWEVGMVQALVRHIVRQGIYKAEDIAVLTPYTGNLQKLRASLSSDFEITINDRDEEAMAKDGFAGSPIAADSSILGLSVRKERLVECLRLATVDNFQGRKPKLSSCLWINVLLSRAQHGMYLIGNVDTYSNVAMWNEVRSQLEAAGRIGRAMELCCPRHPDTAIRCSEPDDFSRFSPEGGCSLACDRRLTRCGHRCQAKCHSETMHEAFLCPQPCPRRHDPCSHRCDKLCGEDCGKCMVPMHNVLLPCGHFADDIPCHQAQQPSKIICSVEVKKEMSRPKISTAPRNAPHCLASVAIAALGLAGSAERRKTAKSIWYTSHARCCASDHATLAAISVKKAATQGSLVALAIIAARFGVRTLDVRLSVKTHVRPALRSVPGTVHIRGCPGLCGETCLEDYCQACQQKLDNRVDLLEFRTYGDIDLNESPVVKLSCGHFFTAESLDGLVNVAAVYTFDAAGRYNGIKDPSEVLALPSCPDCKQPIRQFATQRYNRIINMAVMDETSKKFQMKGEASLKKLEESLDAMETSLENSFAGIVKDYPGRPRLNILRKETDPFYDSRYGRCTKLGKEIQAFCKKTGKEQQPAKKLSDAIVHTKRSRKSHGSSLDDDMKRLDLKEAQVPAPVFNQQIMLGARMARLRVDDMMVRDQLRLTNAKPTGDITWPKGRDPTLLALLFLRESEAFINDCRENHLPRLAAQASIAFARMVGYLDNKPSHPVGGGTAEGASGDEGNEKARAKSEHARAHRLTTTRQRLDDAAQMCEAGFEGAKELLVAVKGLQRLFEKRRECRAPIGGQQHQLVEGASRAHEME
ncbi:uncharacterized protein PG998_010662 [Apiospora kogelbergensis]|uniref:uncharacterized protein n=1 Tax=Apiospora kogelbergensis TaxID=1337665 RepID=UPI00313234D8